MCYSVQPRDQIFVKDDGFLSFVENMGRNIGKNLSISLSATDALKTTSKRKNYLVHCRIVPRQF